MDSPGSPDDDVALVARLRAGADGAADVLVDRHWHACWRVARGILGDPVAAEDVVQESLVAALNRLHTFDPRRGEFGAWLHRITVNRALTDLRRARRTDLLGEATPREEAPEATAGDDGFLAAVATLPPPQRAVIVLRYGLDYAPPEIAAVLEIPVGTVNSRLSRALDALRQTMEQSHVR